MRIEQQRVGTVDVLTPVGPLVDQDGQRFTQLLVERAEGANPRIVAALHDVPYLDSSALEGLLTAAEQLNARACSLKVAAANPTCREIFELTGVAGHLRFFRDVQDAVRSFL